MDRTFCQYFCGHRSTDRRERSALAQVAPMANDLGAIRRVMKVV
jgi:hypothetical protein